LAINYLLVGIQLRAASPIRAAAAQDPKGCCAWKTRRNHDQRKQLGLNKKPQRLWHGSPGLRAANLTTACRPLIRLDHGFVFAVKFDGGISEVIELFSQKQAQAR